MPAPDCRLPAFALHSSVFSDIAAPAQFPSRLDRLTSSVMAGLDPAIHVDARHKAGHDRTGGDAARPKTALALSAR
jgi:hypothetical protein